MVVCVGVAVLVVAVIALHQPKVHTNAAAGSGTVSASSTAGTATASAPASRPSASSTAAPRASAVHHAHRSRSSATSMSAQDHQHVKDVPIVVLNNTTTQGLAQGAAQRFEDDGWTVSQYGNLTNDILSTCAYYATDVPQAKRAANSLRAQYPTIKRVRPQFAELGAYHSPVVVVLTPDYSAG